MYKRIYGEAIVMKIMILGGGINQLPLLEAAKKRGYHIILCDYKEDNPGRALADQFFRVSTLDRNVILAVAQSEHPDGIISNSEPAMKIAAYVADAIGRPCNPPHIINALSRKDLFRRLLEDNGFPTPRSFHADSLSEVLGNIENLRFPVMIKPVDSSGSRGVTKLADSAPLKEAYEKALNTSSMGRVVVEEYIENAHEYLIGGDIFVWGGKVVFSGLMDCFRDVNINPLVPSGTLYPATLSAEDRLQVLDMIGKVLKALEISFGAFNVEIILGADGNMYLVEMNPRNGGNHIPELLRYATGFDIYDATVAAAMGEKIIPPEGEMSNCFFTTHVVHSSQNGILRKVRIAASVSSNVIRYHEVKRPGEYVERFENADQLIGILFLSFGNKQEMAGIISRINEVVEVEIDDCEGKYAVN